ncbi:hypothetical protein BH09PLA1_BH09PLA1_25430 [soil metagenome]
MTTEQRIAAAEASYERHLEWFSRFDNRSAIVLGVDTAMLGVMSSLAPNPANWTCYMALSFTAAVILLAISVVYLARATYPDTVAPARSLLFFGTIGHQECAVFKGEYMAQTEDVYLTDLLEQIHRLSEILCTKFDRLKLAYKAIYWALIPWSLTLVLFRVAG